MSSTSEGRARQAASEAKESAAVAKTYANKASQAEDFSNQAQASAEAAAVSAGSANDSSSSASESENNAAASAAIASEAAQNATITSNLYPTLAEAQAAITAGTIPVNALFNVAVPAGSTPPRFADQYKNVAGVATRTGVMYPSAESVNEVADKATATDNRTQGLSSSKNARDLLEFVSTKGSKFGSVNNTGVWNFPGGIDSSTIDILKVNLGDSAIAKRASSNYDFSLVSGGRIPFGLRSDGYGTIEYQGIPLTNIRGQLPNDFAYAGDSITALTEAATSGTAEPIRNLAPLVCAQGWPIWAQHFSNGLIRYSGVYATGGFTTAQILQIHIPQVVAAKPSFCVVLAGRNDINQKINIDITLANLKSMFLTLRRAGIIPVVCTMCAQSENDTQQNILQSSINDWLVSYAVKYGLPLVDFHSATIDPATGTWAPGYNFDKSHPTPVGARAMGKRLSDTMTKWVAPTYPRIAVEQSDPATHPNQIPNPLLYANDGVNPSGWTVITPGTSAVVDDASITGKAWQLSSGADRSITIPVVSGASYGFGFKFKTVSENTCEVYAVAGSDRTATSGYLAGIKRWQGNTVDFGVFYDEFTVPAGVSNITVCIRSDGSVLSLAQITLSKLTGV